MNSGGCKNCNNFITRRRDRLQIAIFQVTNGEIKIFYSRSYDRVRQNNSELMNSIQKKKKEIMYNYV